MAINAGAEFQALPLEYIVASPLIAAVRAQTMAAQNTVAYINSFIDDKGSMKTTSFNFEKVLPPDATGQPAAAKVALTVPLISLVPVPHLRIEEVNTEFQYTVSETVNAKSSFDWDVEAKVSGGANWGVAKADFSVTAHVASKSSQESTINRSGSVTVKVKATEAPMPEGLARVLTMLSSAIGASEGK